MRDYGKVSPKFWIGATGKALRKKGTACQLVSLYLMTCSHANMIGLYYLPKNYIAHECGLHIDEACAALDGAIAAGFCSYDEESEMIWVHEMATYQIAESLEPKDKRVKGVQNAYEEAPDCIHLAPFFERYKGAYLMVNKRGHINNDELERGFDGVNAELRCQEQEQEHDQKQEQDQGAILLVGDKSPTKPAGRKKWGTDEDHRLARWVYPRVLVVNPAQAEPNWDAWANDVRLMRESDKRTHRDISELFAWANRDAFWCDKIMCPGTLRDKWDKLVVQRNRATSGVPVVAQGANSLDEVNARNTAAFLAGGSPTTDDHMTLDMEVVNAGK